MHIFIASGLVPITVLLLTSAVDAYHIIVIEI